MSVYQPPLLPLPATMVAEIERFDRDSEKAKEAVEMALVYPPDFDTQRRHKWPNNEWIKIMAPAWSRLFRAACDHGYGQHGCREDLTAAILPRTYRHPANYSEKYRDWWKEAEHNANVKKIMGDMPLFNTGAK